MQSDADSKTPLFLDGLRVLDLSRVLAGPLCTMMLADLGADVIKIERPDGGDETRGWGPPFDGRGESAYFLSVNRNKRSVAARLDAADDVALLRRLLQDADVVVDKFRPGTLERHGIDPEACLRERPGLVWCTITGFGPGSRRPGYDFVVQAESGWMAITGEPDGEPMKTGVALADVLAGKDAAIAILAALARRRTGSPVPRVFISLAASARAALVNAAQNALVAGTEARRWGNAHPNLVPYQLFEAADRAIVIAVGRDAQWLGCARVLGLDALALEPALATNAGRVEHRERVIDAIAGRVRRERAGEWLAAFERAGVPAGIVRSVSDVVVEAGGSPLFGMPPSVPGSVRLPPPRLDEHGADVRTHGWRAANRGADA